MKPWLKWIIGVGFAWLAVVILTNFLFIPARTVVRANARRGSCISNLKQIAMACNQYLADYDVRYPVVTSSNKQGWADVLQPYYRSRALFQCPEGYPAATVKSSDYFYNSRVANRRITRWKSLGQVIVFGDGLDNAGTNSSLSSLPNDWKTSGYSPATRHMERANYGFADGHVKSLRPEQISMQPRDETKPDIYTFDMW